MRRGKILRKIVLEDGRIVGFQLAGDMQGAGVYRSLMLRSVDVGRLGARLLDAGYVIATQASQPQALAA
jgi:NAD(P)H-nitrite reductase large subunit